MNSCRYFLQGYLKDCVFCTTLHTALKVQLGAVAENITGDIWETQLIITWFIYNESMKMDDLVSYKSRRPHAHKTSRKYAFHVPCTSVPDKIMNIPYI
jgi:hypothetical protein